MPTRLPESTARRESKARGENIVEWRVENTGQDWSWKMRKISWV